MHYWLAATIGAGMGALMLALFARVLPARPLALQGYLALIAMLAIYIGARLVGGDLQAILTEVAIASIAAVAAWLTMAKWLPSIGIAIMLHGLYDAVIGPHMGVVEWYPPLCAGFDIIVGIGLFSILIRRGE